MSSSPKAGRFLANVLWNWFGVSVTIFSALILSPIVIRRLGDENFGLWALTTTLVDYYWLLDFGMRAATIRYTVHFQSTNQPHQLNQVINTTLAYSLTLIPVLLLGTWFGGPALARQLNIQHPLFPKLLFIVAVSWALTSVLVVFTSCVEGMQRFDLVNQISFSAIAIKSTGTFALLQLGYGVIEMAWLAVFTQFLLHSLSFFALRSVFPNLRLSFALANWQIFRTMIAYGAHSLTGSIGQRLLSMTPPLLVGYFLPTRYVGYFTAPIRLLDYTVEAVARIGNVSNTSAGELAAQNRHAELLDLAILVNRYSLLIFLPLSIFLAVYGPALLAVWIHPAFAREASGVLLALLPGITLANAGQYSSGSILSGIGRHRNYSRSLVAEALLTIAALWFILPRYGIAAGAATISALMILNRALGAVYWITSELRAPYFPFLFAVYQPLIAVIPVGGVLFALQPFLPGRNWPELFLAGGICVVAYVPFAIWLIRPAHRQLARTKFTGLFHFSANHPAN
jgi:O-antigen/teichoic acid export membrane protein